ncbi:hypothetical protein M5X00_22685 [Paenibacillus alvei]|uniref:Uncharacterized protein n=1 Tax=Paenibacillus alvei TaxID=44250 RepID=A0ABT4GY71_PAEAL|nr:MULTISPECIES: hypothetical protein [Paenibacillus]EJW16308.1 hypothetical protein PAV_6c03900 [Paenibacillus alvei DSM 29]MCY7483064.1 hypothetical protein [Paenibacillus alvei]MCY9544562.1 hypothetical protein [Paenibacillus alvei]MCY9704364.1 hypothetical protein [Paenibacillus alvei]MCY9737353.1 hypothetical protein [Paenibacillus alvei]
MRTMKTFLLMLAELLLGMYYGICRKGEHFDKKTAHLSGYRYLAFVMALLLTLLLLTICLYPFIQ